MDFEEQLSAVCIRSFEQLLRRLSVKAHESLREPVPCESGEIRGVVFLDRGEIFPHPREECNGRNMPRER